MTKLEKKQRQMRLRMKGWKRPEKPRGPGRSRECRYLGLHSLQCPKLNCSCRCHEWDEMTAK